MVDKITSCTEENLIEALVSKKKIYKMKQLLRPWSSHLLGKLAFHTNPYVISLIFCLFLELISGGITPGQSNERQVIIIQ
ncbi:hypothetical protein Pint_30943 [Pistacia integerrima]|uniref:Uncharacterized protein n=1 Tax=Pistacia integerrima TaxID=434235 RepID=A0ACC0XQS5_9ROSI|nr:hypothetical protein Pint_30943 [Pistacia integerrima]